MIITRHYKKAALLSVAMIMAFSLCACGGDKLEKEDLLGTWYADLPESEYKTITFNEDKSYATEDFVSDGTFQIARDGNVKLVDTYKEVSTIIAYKESGQWRLEYELPYGSLVFTREVREKPQNVQVGQSAREPKPSEIQLMYMAAIDQILVGSAWTDTNGTTVVFTGEEFTVGEQRPVAYIFRTGEGIEGGYRFTIENPKGTYVGTIGECYDGDELSGYTLVLELNGEKIISASCSGAVELTQP